MLDRSKGTSATDIASSYGSYGYGHILREFVGTLSDYGLGETEIEQLLIQIRPDARPGW